MASYETVIIGSGIAGATAAIYAARKKMNYAIIADKFGGQFLESNEIQNYPGVISTSGAQFASILQDQLKFTNVNVHDGVKAENIEKKENHFIIKTNKGDYETKTIIIATGARARELNVSGEEKFKHKGVTYCAICDGPLFKGKTVAVIGGGNSALESVEFLVNIVEKIYVINLTAHLTGFEYLIERAKSHKNVEIINNAKTVEIFGNNFVEGLKYEQSEQLKELKVQGIFVDIGRAPNTEFVKGFLELDADGHIIIDCPTSTKIPGIFAAGDCSSVHEYQYVIAAGQGCTALLKAAKYLAYKK